MFIFSAYLVTYRKIHRHINNTKNLRMRKNARSKEKRSDRPVYATTMMKVIAKILTAVWIAYTPYITVSLVWSFFTDMYRTNKNLLSFVLYLSYLLVYMNSTMHAVIFLNGNETSSSFVAREFHRARPNSIFWITETSQSAMNRGLPQMSVPSHLFPSNLRNSSKMVTKLVTIQGQFAWQNKPRKKLPIWQDMNAKT